MIRATAPHTPWVWTHLFGCAIDVLDEGQALDDPLPHTQQCCAQPRREEHTCLMKTTGHYECDSSKGAAPTCPVEVGFPMGRAWCGEPKGQSVKQITHHTSLHTQRGETVHTCDVQNLKRWRCGWRGAPSCQTHPARCRSCLEPLRFGLVPQPFGSSFLKHPRQRGTEAPKAIECGNPCTIITLHRDPSNSPTPRMKSMDVMKPSPNKW